ncbi:autotransporter-associated beta strand repeat-containing protein [Candidatus Rhabdochlamydia sp. T3358]|uniref:autotransporter outer membrane beta-barrel domain-containing protein n=1 Tax=Candidatus Rhabdochlamydia sp. T3358 TaxID=2099795 RepID=UPI0010B7DEE6|nr:autotransporter-associated beta strand repeat-containing protein [Candidatus Rhabdochlamydia sp. T3358]VHO02956.1 Autotransporter-associated beta strand repeat protein [Candidatus Rhabdochlamydia sp. T3358]
MRVIRFLIFSALSLTPLWGINVDVTNNADSGTDSLRAAINEINAALDPTNTITFFAGLGTITLLSDLPLIGENATFITSVTDSLVIDGTAGPYRIFGAQDFNVSIQASSSSTLTLSGVLDGNGALQNSSNGTLILNGINTYTGGTIASGGVTINLSGTGSLPNQALIINTGSILNISAITPASQTISSLSGSGNGQIILGAKELIVNTTISTTYPGFISGSGSFTKQGSGTLTLTGPNTYLGGTTVGGGVLQGNTTSLQGNILNNASVVFDQATTGAYAGNISGSGSITKQNSGTLIVTGTNTYTGGTTVSGGVLQGDTTSLQGNILNNASVVFDQATTGTYAGVMSGTGSLTKQNNNGSLILTGANTYSGGTTVSGGVLQGNTTSLQGNILNNAIVIFDQATTGTYSGVVSGNGGLIKNNSGTLILTGANTYSGILGTVVSGGTLQGNTTSLQGNISNNASVVFDQATTGTYAGVISGSGGLTKQGTGTVIFTNDSSGFSAGTVNILEGAVIVNGILGGTVTLVGNSILGGTGTIVGDVFNDVGSVRPGNSIGTLTINGNYTGFVGGELLIEINEAGASDLLDVTGTASLNGALHVSPGPGVYLEGTTYTFLNAGSVTGQFLSTFSDQPLNYTINYFPTQAQIFILASSLILPARPNGNAGSIVDYLFCSSFDFANLDLDAVAEALLILPADQYAQALNRLTPSQFGALALNELENNFSVANTFLETNQATCCYNFCESTNLWINPLGLVYSQKNRLQLGQEAIGFTNHTYGVAAGIDHLFSNDWTLGFGLGYSYSHLHWKNQAGKAKANSGYLGPYIKYNCGSFYFDFLVLGTGNFYDVDRRVVFPGIDRKAHSHPSTWDLSEVILAGFKLEPFYNFFVQPEFLIDQLNIFQESFHESGAGSIDLSVKRKYASFLRSLINLKFVKEWAFCNMCLAPSVNVGWLRTTPLTGRHYTASFRKDTFCEPNFSVTSFSEVVDQVLVSGQLLFSSQGGFSMSLGYEGRFGNGSKVNEVDVALDWRF